MLSFLPLREPKMDLAPYTEFCTCSDLRRVNSPAFLHRICASEAQETGRYSLLVLERTSHVLLWTSLWAPSNLMPLSWSVLRRTSAHALSALFQCIVIMLATCGQILPEKSHSRMLQGINLIIVTWFPGYTHLFSFWLGLMVANNVQGPPNT